MSSAPNSGGVSAQFVLALRRSLGPCFVRKVVQVLAKISSSFGNFWVAILFRKMNGFLVGLCIDFGFFRGIVWRIERGLAGLRLGSTPQFFTSVFGSIFFASPCWARGVKSEPGAAQSNMR